jgi:hypothetical protein
MMNMIGLGLLGIGAVILAALLGAITMWVGWNYGVLAAFPAFGLGKLSLLQSFCFSLGLVSVGNALKGASVSA